MGDEYYMWYGAIGSLDGETQTVGVGLATSPDGIHWTKHPDNPLLIPEPGQWDATHLISPHVMQHEGLFYLWYTAASDELSAPADATNHQIGLATSPDGIHWTRHTNNPVLFHGPTGTWSADSIMSPTVVDHPRDGLVMYFYGFDAPYPNFSVWSIGRAVAVE